MSSHTPGPWSVTADQFRDLVVAIDGTEIAIVTLEDDVTLIAAAPELLAALRKLEVIVSDLENTLTEKAWVVVSAHLTTARAAIAKAEGK